MSENEYLARERLASEKHLLWRGEVFAMAGGTPAHNVVCANVTTALNNALRDAPCTVLSSDMKVHVPATRGFVYPDVVVVCGAHALFDDTGDVLTNPKLVVEVLSESIEAFDRGEKFAGYRTIASLTDYLLVSPTARHVEHYARRPDGSWVLRDHHEADRVAIESLAVTLALDDVYRKVDLALA